MDLFQQADLRLKVLDAALIVDGFVDGIDEYSYEDYLRDFLNASSYFREKSPLGYLKPHSESNGENDAEGKYSIDFKLLAGKTRLQASSILTHQVTEYQPGVHGYGLSKVPEGKVKVTWIHVAFRHLSYDDLLRIRKENVKAFGLENDVCEVLKTFETKKNIFLFFPFEMNYTLKNTETPITIPDDMIEQAAGYIATAIYWDFKQAFEYRKNVAGKFDTYFACVFQNYILIYKLDPERLQFVDRVSLEKSILYTKLSFYKEW